MSFLQFMAAFIAGEAVLAMLVDQHAVTICPLTAPALGIASALFAIAALSR